jgi:predicted ATP-grasp superfamily ATP-dependent carboligase
MILYYLLFVIIIILLLVLSLTLSSFLRQIFYNNVVNESLPILFLTDYNNRKLDNSKHWGQAVYYNYVLSKFLIKMYPAIQFSIYLKALHENTDINELKSFINHNNIKIIIPTEATNALLLSKYKHHFYNIRSYFIDRYEYYNILDDKYKLKYFCEKNAILYPNTISVSDRSICEVMRFINKYNKSVFLKRKSNTLGGEDVHDLTNMNIVDNIKGKITSSEWIIQKRIDGIFVGVDVLYIHGEVKGITFHKNNNYKKMYKGYSNYYFPSSENMYSHRGLRMNEYFYVEFFLEIIEKIGYITTYNGLMNIDFIYQLINNKIRIYLLEINPRIGGSIHISTHSGLLKSYFDYLIYNKKNERVIKYKNIEIEKWSNHRYTTLIPYIFDNMNVILNIDNMKNDSKFSL